MPWRFLLFIFALLIGCLFALFNSGTVDITFGFVTLKSVYLSAALLVSFVLGALSILPFALMRSFRKKEKTPKIKPGSPETDAKDAPQTTEEVKTET